MQTLHHVCVELSHWISIPTTVFMILLDTISGFVVVVNDACLQCKYVFATPSLRLNLVDNVS